MWRSTFTRQYIKPHQAVEQLTPGAVGLARCTCFWIELAAVSILQGFQQQTQMRVESCPLRAVPTSTRFSALAMKSNSARVDLLAADGGRTEGSWRATQMSRRLTRLIHHASASPPPEAPLGTSADLIAARGSAR